MKSRHAEEFEKKFPRVTNAMLHTIHKDMKEHDARRRKRNRIYCMHLDSIGGPAAWKEHVRRCLHEAR